MRLWQLIKPEFVPGVDGEGARLNGGRWNSPGVPAVYCASSVALAALEVLVNLPPEQRRKGNVPSYVAVGLEVPDGSIVDPGHPAGLPEDQSRRIGDDWLNGLADLGLSVPSSVVQLECNVILNPRHSAMAGVKVAVTEPFEFDDRLLG
jgi:RES domain-containing protein